MLDHNEKLRILERQIAQDLASIHFPTENWTRPLQYNKHEILDVLIIGGGMFGLATSFALKKEGIHNVRIIDKAEKHFEGPWSTFARMKRLNSHKLLAGPSLELPSLTFGAWYKAQYGEARWDSLVKATPAEWMEYLIWYSKTLDLKVSNRTEAIYIVPIENDIFRTEVRNGAITEHIFSRKIVLATGIDGLGRCCIPPFARQLSTQFYAHSNQNIHFPSLKNKTVAVVGFGAAAMDNAIKVLSAGAEKVIIITKRASLDAIYKTKSIYSKGFVRAYPELPDEWKLKFIEQLNESPPPPINSLKDLLAYSNLEIRLESNIKSVDQRGNKIVINDGKAALPVDYMILCTGYEINASYRKELRFFNNRILTWQDKYQELSASPFGHYPYLDMSFGFISKYPGSYSQLQHIHCLNHAALLSHGGICSHIEFMDIAVNRLAQGIAAGLFVSEKEFYLDKLKQYNINELEEE